MICGNYCLQSINFNSVIKRDQIE